MAIEVLLDLIKQRFPPAERKIVAKALQQDPLVWQFANNEEESLPYFETAATDLAAFTPAACAVWLIKKRNEIELVDLAQIESTLPNPVRQIAGKAFESTFNAGLPPADLYTAGLLALALRERRKIKGNWDGIADEILIKRGEAATQKNVLIWQTVFSILLSLSPDFIELILDFIQTKSEQKAKTGAHLLVHAVLSNPLTDQEKLDQLYQGLSSQSIDAQLETLKWLNAYHQTDLSKSLARTLLQVKTNVNYFARVFSEWEAFEAYSESTDPLSKQIRFTLPEDLNRFAAFSFYSGDSAKAADTYLKAGKVLDVIKAQTLFQSIAGAAGAEDKTAWLEIIQTLPHSRQARLAYIQSLIETQKTDEARPLMAELPDSAEKAILEAQISPDRSAKVMPAKGKQSPPAVSYFVHTPEVNASKAILKAKVQQSGARQISLSMDVDYSDPEMIALARDYQINVRAYEKAIELTSYLELLEPEADEHPRTLAQLYALAKRWPQAYTAVQQIVKAQAAPAIDDLTLFAESALHTDRVDMAISISQNILKQSPQHPKALILLGKGFWQKGDIVKAIQHMENVVETIPEEAETWLALAEIWQENGQFDRALEVLHKGVLAIPGNPAILRKLGLSLLEKQSPADALTYLKKANELDHQNTEGQLNLAKAYYQLGHYPEAWQLLEPYFDQYEHDPEIAKLLGFVLLGMKKEVQAKPILLHAAGQSPEDRETVMATARLVITDAENALGEVNEPELISTRAILAQSLEKLPEDAYLQLHLADLDRLLGRHQLALDAYVKLTNRASTEKSGPSWQLQYGLGQSALALGKVEMSLAALQEAAAHQPESTRILHGLAEAYQCSELAGKASETARTALKLAPRDLQNILWYAHFRSDNNQPEEAVKALKEALIFDSERPQLKLWLAKTLISTGELQAAEENLLELIASAEPTAQELHQAARIGVQLNNLDLTIKALEKACQISEDFDPVLVMDLAVAYATQEQRRKALETLNLADSILIENPEVALLKSDLLNHLGQYELALSTLKLIESTAADKLAAPGEQDSALAKSPLLYAINFSRPSYYYRMGQLHRILGNAEQAKASFAQALELDPMDQKSRLASVENNTFSIAFDEALQMAEAEWPDLKNQDVIDLACTQAEIHFYLDQPDQAAQHIKRLATGIAAYPRVLALQSRMAAGVGDLDLAQDYLSEALNAYQEYFDPMPSTSVQDIFRQVLNLNGIAEAAADLKDLPLAVDLHSRAVKIAEGQPLLAWRYSRTLMLAAEAQRLAEALFITAHAPGKQTVSAENEAQFNHYLGLIQPLLSQETWLCLKARGAAAFAGEWQLELNVDACLNDPQSAAAVILSSNDEITVRRALEAHPDNAQVMQAFGVYALRHGKADGVQMAEKALQLDPVNPTNHALLAYLNQADPKQALKSIETALQFWPEEAQWHAFAADLELQTGLSESASQHIAFALDSEPGNAQFWQKSAEIKLQSNDLEHARADLEKSITYQSSDANAWLKLADVNRRMGATSEAIRNVQNAEKLDPQNKSIALQEAQLFLDQKDFPQALDKARTILERDQNNEDARLILAQAHARQGQYQQALSTLGRTENVRLALEAVKIKKEFEGAETALPELIALAEANPDNPQVLTLLTDLLIQTNRLDKAQKTAQTILRILPEEAEVHLMLGRLQRMSGQLDQAIAHLSDAIAYDPTLVEAYIELGKTYQDRRDLEEAIKVFQKGAEANATDPRPYYFAGLALKECKDYAGAEAMLKQAKHYAPNDPNIIRQLGVITAMNLINHLRETS